jgi:putative phosphoesterase
VGVISDTHIPDRVNELHPDLISGLRVAQVSTILHAGDISIPSVLRQLEEIAPVYAVRGNRDFTFAGVLPWIQKLTFLGVPLTLVHGMGTWRNYFFDKFKYALTGYRLGRYQGYMRRSVADAKVVVYGHTHHAENKWQDGRLWFNPGSAVHGDWYTHSPSYGLLHFSQDGAVVGEIIKLTGAHLEYHQWAISK